MKSYIQMIYIDNDGDARQTNVGAAMLTNAGTREAFNGLRKFSVPIEAASFICDYYNSKGDLSDTIPIHREDFATITGKAVKTDAEYREIDKQYWREVSDRRSSVS